MGICGQLLLIIFHYNVIKLLILTWPVFWVPLNIIFLILIIYLWLCRSCFSNSGCFLENYLTIILLENLSELVAVCPLLTHTCNFYSLVKLFTGKYSSSASSYWMLWTHWAVCFGVSRCIYFLHIPQVVPAFCSSNWNGIFLTLSC